MSNKQVAINAKGRRVGETHQRAKLTDADVEMILALHDEGIGYRQIAKKFDETITDPATGQELPGYRPGWSTVRDVVKGRTRGQVIAKWRWIVSGEVEPPAPGLPATAPRVGGWRVMQNPKSIAPSIRGEMFSYKKDEINESE